MKKYFSKRLQTFSGSLKATRVLKRLPHSLRSFAITDFLFSGSLKNRFSKLFKLCLITIFTFSAHPIFAQNDLDKTYHYTPGGKYRMFGAGRGKVEKVRNTINKITDTFKMGPLSIDTDQYSGYVYYEQRFSNHPLSEHGSFFNSDTIKIGDIHGNIFRGNLGYTNAKINGYETHPVDGYDAADGGDHPYDIYTYHVTGTVKTTSIQPLELPKLPKFSNPFSNKNADVGQNKNGLPENNPADANDRTRDLTATGNPNLPNTEADGNNGFNNNGEVPLPQASDWKDILDGGLGFADGLAKSFFDEAKTTADVVTHPVDTTKNLANAAKTVANNPTSVGKAVQQTVADAIDEKVANYDKAQTAYQRGFEVGTIPVAIVGAVLPSNAAGKAKAVTEVAKAVDKASDTANAAKKVEKAKKVADVYPNAPLGSSRNQMNHPKPPEYQSKRNLPTNINGREYTGHGLDRMQDRGILPSVVENTIKNGSKTAQDGGKIQHYDPVNNVTVITNKNGGGVTTHYGQH